MRHDTPVVFMNSCAVTLYTHNIDAIKNMGKQELAEIKLKSVRNYATHFLALSWPWFIIIALCCVIWYAKVSCSSLGFA